MMLSSISAPGPTTRHNIIFPLNQPKLLSSINSSPGGFAEKNRKCKHVPCKYHLMSCLPCHSAGGSSDKERREAPFINLIRRPEIIPKHVAVIMDGNRRWAAEKGLTGLDGYAAAARAFRKMARLLYGMGVKVVSVFAFSTENWTRPQEEVEDLMGMFQEKLEVIADIIAEYNARVSVIGDTSKFPESLRKHIAIAEMVTKANKGPHLLMALNYGGRQDILGAAKAIWSKVKDGKMLFEEINEKSFEEELQTKCTEFPCPDLLIRTSGEKRLSNFLLWQMAHTPLHFLDKFFPDLNEHDIMEAMALFQQSNLDVDVDIES